jgi:chemotaxis protein histidine kinase CheA
VIKALDPVVTTMHSAVAGATIMGDGSVVLIIDVPALFEGGRRTALIHERGELALHGDASGARET